MIECKNCKKQYIGQTKRRLNERFGEHRRAVEHFNEPGHSLNDTSLIPLELVNNNRDSVRKAREAHLIDKPRTVESSGINRRDEHHYCAFQ